MTSNPELVRSAVRWRALLAALALIVPALLHLVFERQARRLDGLADHGAEALATVERVTARGSATYTEYAYEVGGEIHTWSVSRELAPFAPGERFPILVLPEDPSLSRPGVDREAPRLEATHNRAFTWKLLAGVFAFFVVNAAVVQLKLRRLRAGASPGLLVPAPWLGRAVAGTILAVVLATNFSADIAAFQEKAFGARVLGVPVAFAVSLVEAVLFAPFFWVFDHLMRIVVVAAREGASLTRFGIATYVLRVHRLHPELARSRVVALAGLAYFVVIAGSWIGYAAWRGI